MLAGPNGAGKTTLYERILAPLTAAEFVNPDRLVLAQLGRHGETRADAELGQRLAEARREVLMAAGESLVMESTFSHPSKLELIRDARARGYGVNIYHVNVRSVEHALLRVASRVAEGGHPVPEANVRGRFERNPPLIREAVPMADGATVFDNSAIGRPPRRLLRFSAGKVIFAAEDLPDWAATLYGGDLTA